MKSNSDAPNQRFNKTRIASAVSAVVVLSSLSGNVFAQELEEIIVTATKRAESVQSVPLAITALSGQLIKDVNLNDVKDLVAITPGVTGNSQDSFIDAISVRGVRTQDFGVGADPSAAFFKNDLYEGRNGSAVTSLYDVDRAEILRGPQGFLFGRSSIGGAFNVHTTRAKIDSKEASVDLDLAERGHIVAEAAFNIPVNDTFAMRIAAYSSQEDGFVENLRGGEDLISHDKKAIRWSTTTEKDNLSIYTTLEYETREQSGSVYRAITNNEIWDTLEAAVGPIPIRGGPEQIDVDLSGGDQDNADILTAGVRVDYDLGFATLTSNTGFKDHDYFYEEDYDGTPIALNNYRQDQTGDYFQQELRLTSAENDGPFSWYAGVSYYKENINTNFTFTARENLMCQYYGYYYNAGMTFGGCEDLYAYYEYYFTPSADGNLTESGRVIGKYSGWATYLNLDFAVSDTVDLSLGLRYTKDTKDFSMNVPTPNSELGAYWAYGFTTTDFIRSKQSWDDVTPRVLATWKPTDDRMFYASFTQGFKSGGFGTFSLNDANGISAVGTTDIAPGSGFRADEFNSEFMDSYEIGYKDSYNEGRTKVALTAFFYDYTDLQVTTADSSGAAAVANAGQIDGSGLEGSLTTAIGDNYKLYLAMAYLDTEGSDLQAVCSLADANGCEGSSLYWAPEFSGALVFSGEYPTYNGSIKGSLEASWESERGGGFENLASTKIASYTEVALRLTYYSNDSWHVGAYVENVTDEFTWDGQNNNGGIVPSHFFGPKRPRTVGVVVGYNWN